jgi:signal peptidase II
MNKQKKIYFFSIFIFLLLCFDQALKIYVKTHFLLGEEVAIIGRWFKLVFVENEGMAFGISFGGSFGKYLLTLIRIFAVIIFMFFLIRSIKRNTPFLQSLVYALIVAGALGNIIDSLFYGVIFEQSPLYGSGGAPARIFPPDAGYAPFMKGRVVDMLYFPIIDTDIPSYVPIWGGKHFVFFEPIFNLADSYVTIAVLIMLVFYKKVFPELKN